MQSAKWLVPMSLYGLLGLGGCFSKQGGKLATLEEISRSQGAVDFVPERSRVEKNPVLVAQNQFGYRLFSSVLKEKATDGENVFLSPPSAFFALSMLLAGAGSTTLEGMLAGLQLNPGYAYRLPEIHSTNYAYLERLQQFPGGLTLTLASALWADVGFPLQGSFLETARSIYSAVAANGEFKANPQAVASEINGWAAEATRSRVQAIIDQETVVGLDLLLANAIYFKGIWQTEFDPELTTSQAGYFTKTDGNTLDAQVMRSSTVDYYQGHGAQVARLLFRGGSASFYVVLPPTDINAKQWMAEYGVSDEFWNSVLSGLKRRQRVNFELPKFKFNVGKKLNRNLIELGMGEMLQLGADFVGLSMAPSFVDYVRQDAFVQVDETGAEAAVVTSIGVTRSGQVESFLVNRPFAIAVRDNIQGVFLFHGLVENPSWAD